MHRFRHRFRAIVFDLDGTLVDSAGDIRAVVNGILADMGRAPLSLDAVIAMIGDGPAKLLERALAASGGIDGVDVPRLVRHFIAVYDASPVTLTVPYPHVEETLARMRAEGVRLAICSNKPVGATRAVLAALALEDHFAAVIGSGSVAGAQKPDPRILLATLAAMGATTAEAVMVGDAPPDVQVARNAGVPVVLRAGGYTRVPAADLGADAVFEDFRTLPAVLRSLP